MPKVGEPFEPNEMFGFLLLPAPVLEAEDISSRQKLVWAVLRRELCEGSGVAGPTLKADIADKIGVKESDVDDDLADLNAEGYVSVATSHGVTTYGTGWPK